MPIYEYRCKSCQKVSEHLFIGGYSDLEGKVFPCPTCGCQETEKMLSTPAFTLSWAPCQYDVADPWEGTALEGAGEPDKLNYESEKIFIDHGVETKQGGETRPKKDWLSSMPEGVGT
jgi:putative FmdB family regulatory protein